MTHDSNTPERGPYALAQPALLAAGWPSVLPVPGKSPPPDGCTGRAGVDPDAQQHAAWLHERGHDNPALRLPLHVVGIDVDAYKDNGDRSTLDRIADALGAPLPDTWMVTSRADGSGIRLYGLSSPRRRRWSNPPGNAEVVHNGWRYVVAPGAVHPSGNEYQWVHTGTGEVRDGLHPPTPDDLAVLDDDHPIVTLWSTPDDGTSAAPALSDADTAAWLDEHDVGEQPCTAMRNALRRFHEGLDEAASRHDEMLLRQGALVRAAERGHCGLSAALGEAREAFIAAVTADGPGQRTRSEAAEEWQRALRGAVALVVGDPTPALRVGCSCRDSADGEADGVLEVVFEDDGDGDADDREHDEESGAPGRYHLGPSPDDPVFTPLWERESLAHLRRSAEARGASPLAVVALALVRVSMAVSPRVVLPPLVGAEGSLNLFVALVGASGAGKGVAESAAEAALDVGPVYSVGLGSGEGMTDQFVVMSNVKDDKGKVTHAVPVPYREAVLFKVAEVDQMHALTRGRRGSTLGPMLRMAYMGEELSFAYRDPAKRTRVEKHEYRLCMSVGVQPDRGDALLNEDEVAGGTPQRFVWAPTTNPHRPDVPPDMPEPMRWALHERLAAAVAEGRAESDPPPFVVLDVHDDIVEQVLADRNDVLAGKRDPARGHEMLSRLKVAALLALLDGHDGVRRSDWALADALMRGSEQTRLAVEQRLRDAQAETGARRAAAQGVQASIAAETRANRDVGRVAAAVRRKLRRAAPEQVPWSEVRSSVRYGLRDAFGDAVDDLHERGLVEVEETTNERGNDVTLLRWSGEPEGGE